MSDELFGSINDVSIWQAVARALLVLAYGILAVRLVGRRIFGKWSALDIVVSIIVGSNLSRAITGSAPLWATLAATSALLFAHWLLAQAAARSTLFSRLFEGAPVWLARDGKVDDVTRRRRSVSDADIGEALRSSGVETIDDASEIVLEPSGHISSLRK